MKSFLKNIFNKENKTKNDDIIKTYDINKNIDYYLLNLSRKCNVIDDHLLFFIENHSKIIKMYLYDILHIKSNQTYTINNDNINIYYNVIIDGTLKCNEWDNNNKSGGMISINSLNDIIINNNGSINVDGTGYKGGNILTQGESYKGIQQHGNISPNYGGGGSLRGGGGYGTKGDNTIYGGIGGNTYGNKELTILYRGSGGGGGHARGGNGGGIIHLYCSNKFIMNNDSTIQSNGIDGEMIRVGGGSGGSILVNCDIFDIHNTAKIIAIGGTGGGNGRIRINANKFKQINMNQITPQPFIGSL